MLCSVYKDVCSFLSPSIKCLLVDSRQQHVTFSGENNFVTPHLTFNWDRILTHLEPLPDRDVSEQVYFAICQKLWPVFLECGRKLRGSNTFHNDEYRWTDCLSDIKLCYEEICRSNDAITPLKVSLLLSSIFENAVGNVFMLKEKNVPFLLRDLLASDELLNIFGKLPMLVARILLGTPFALNIRNVCWHGFPAPEEIHSDVAATLMVLIASFGEILHSSDIAPVPQKPKIDEKYWKNFQISLQDSRFPQLTEMSKQVTVFLEGCSIIPNTHRTCWISSFKCLCSGAYGECLVLLLPALEHVLRCAFCSLNNCPNRLLVAEQHTLYTTMDEILNCVFTEPEEVGEKTNKLPPVLGVKIMEMLMDMFDSYGGPRLRDKISHGECDFRQIPAIMANHMFCIAILVLLKLGPSENIELCTRLKSVGETYSAKFHSTSILKAQIKKLLGEKFQSLDIHLGQEGNSSNNFCTSLVTFQSDLLSYASIIDDTCFDDIESHIDSLINKPVVTLFRTKSDMSVIISLKNVVVALEQICDNSLVALKSRETSIQQHTLRSRQRVSYYRMVEFIPSLLATVRCTVLLILIQLHSLPNHVISSRFLKNILQYTENTASLSSLDKNRWVEIREKTTTFCDVCAVALYQLRNEH